MNGQLKKNKVTVNCQQEGKRIRDQMVRIFYLGEFWTNEQDQHTQWPHEYNCGHWQTVHFLSVEDPTKMNI